MMSLLLFIISNVSLAESHDALLGDNTWHSPFDNPLLWTGHSTVVDEIVTQLLEQSPDLKMGAILASVGGGGLLSGVFEGIERNYYGSNDARANVVRGSKVFACETDGAASFAASFAASSGKKEVSLVRLSGITSVATSLGALEVTPAVIQRAHRHQERGESSKCGEDVLSYVCSDAEAVDACLRFATDHRMLVEPACGAALAPLYTERMRTMLLNELGRNDDDGENSAIVVEVCGGSGVDLDILQGWKDKYLG
jgi:L-serine/L-threonine ammonia-lyase